MARDEYSTGVPANNRKRPLLTKGAANIAAVVAVADLMSFRRVMRRELIAPAFID
jgi:hypothetical protein